MLQKNLKIILIRSLLASILNPIYLYIFEQDHHRQILHNSFGLAKFLRGVILNKDIIYSLDLKKNLIPLLYIFELSHSIFIVNQRLANAIVIYKSFPDLLFLF
jgi:hypothetical protein